MEWKKVLNVKRILNNIWIEYKFDKKYCNELYFIDHSLKFLYNELIYNFPTLEKEIKEIINKIKNILNILYYKNKENDVVVNDLFNIIYNELLYIVSSNESLIIKR